MITEHDFLNISGTQSDAYDFKQARLGIIGGSGLYRIENLKDIVELSLDTPYGKPSNKLLIGNLFGIEIVFLARHGEKHTLNPSEIPYKANIWAMRSLNVRWLISASAVGSLKENIKPCDIVIPDQFIDRTHQRPLTFFNNGVVAHISMANPFCDILSQILSKEIEKLLPKDKLCIASKIDVFPEPFFPQIIVKPGSKLIFVFLWFLKEIILRLLISIYY